MFCVLFSLNNCSCLLWHLLSIRLWIVITSVQRLGNFSVACTLSSTALSYEASGKRMDANEVKWNYPKTSNTTQVLFGSMRDENNQQQQKKYLYKCACNKKAPSEFFSSPPLCSVRSIANKISVYLLFISVQTRTRSWNIFSIYFQFIYFVGLSHETDARPPLS